MEAELQRRDMEREHLLDRCSEFDNIMDEAVERQEDLENQILGLNEQHQSLLQAVNVEKEKASGLEAKCGNVYAVNDALLAFISEEDTRSPHDTMPSMQDLLILNCEKDSRIQRLQSQLAECRKAVQEMSQVFQRTDQVSPDVRVPRSPTPIDDEDCVCTVCGDCEEGQGEV
jgi:predicted nuclease with TOPRIM domain